MPAYEPSPKQDSPSRSQEPEVDELEDDYDDDDDDDPNVFRVRDPLLPATAKLLTTRQLHDLIHEGAIDINPPYQRDVVWPDSKQIGLIDSIFRNFYIPPVVFAMKTDEDDEQILVCVDGKQRLTSIQKFIDGQIPYKDPKTKKQFWFTVPESKTRLRNQIPDDWKKEFEDKYITCVEYSELPTGAERELFQRVQLGMSLTAAEKLQAIASPWAEWICELEARHVTVDGGLAEVLEWDTTRGRDFQNIAHMVYCCDGFPEHNLPSAQKIEKWISREDAPGIQFKDDIEQVLRTFWQIASNERLNHCFKRFPNRIAPVEFVFIGTLLYVLRKQAVDVQSKAIFLLRTVLRSEHRDIRNNSKIAKCMWWYIECLRNDPSTLPLHSDVPIKPSKRKKQVEEDADDEYRPGPVRNLGKGPKTRRSGNS